MINTALPVLISHIANDNRIIPQMMVFVYGLYIFMCSSLFTLYFFDEDRCIFDSYKNLETEFNKIKGS